MGRYASLLVHSFSPVQAKLDLDGLLESMPVWQFEPEHLGRNTPMAQIRQKRQVFHRDPVKD